MEDDDDDLWDLSTPSYKIMSEILPGKLYLSDMRVANDLKLLQEKDIKGVISIGGMTEQPEYLVHENLEYHWIYIDDEDYEPIKEYFQESIKFIKEVNGAVLIHCWAG